MIEGTYKESVTEDEKITQYSTICPSGALANVTIIQPILTPDERERRIKNAELALEKFAKSVIAAGLDWKEHVRMVEEKRSQRRDDKV